MSIKFIFKADGTEVNNLLAEFKQNLNSSFGIRMSKFKCHTFA